MSYVYVFSTPTNVVRDVIIATPDIIQQFLATDAVYGAVLTPPRTTGLPRPRPSQSTMVESVRAFANGEGELRANLADGSSIRGARVDMTHFRDLVGPTRRAIGEISAQRNLPVEVQKNIRKMVGVSRHRRKTRRN
jgi:hypothetical protein